MKVNALDDVSAEDIEASIPKRPIASLRDIEVLYGALYTLGRGLTGPYGAYLTPDAAAEQVGNEALLTIRVDLRGDSATLADPSVELEMFPEQLISAVAHSKFAAAMGVDHSVTHQSGQTNGPKKHADHAFERLERWPTEDPVAETAANHEDGWLINVLTELSEDEAVETKIRERVTDLIGEEGQLLHTVTVAFDDGDLAVTEQYRENATWHYPGELEILQEAMAARKTGKFRAKNDADDASGDGTCFVFDTEETVYGVVDDPMKHYLSKQMEKFPAFDADESWRTQGLGRDAAIRAQNAETFLDACTVSAPGTSAFYLPYTPGEIDADTARGLYQLLAQQTDSEDRDEDRSPVGATYRELKQQGLLDRLRFSLVIVNKYQKDRWRVLASTPTADTHLIQDITEAHAAAVDSRWLGDDGVFPQRENFPLLNITDPEKLSSKVASVGYLAQTCSGEDNDDPSSDDFRFRATATVASGQHLRVNELLSEYVAELTARFDPDGEYPFPDALLAQQYVQFAALAECELLTPEDETLTTPPDAMTEQQELTTEQSRQETFEQFIKDHPALSDKTREGVFALGALVGRITRYQRNKNKSMTAVKQYPIDNLTKHNITRIATDVVESNVVYSGEEGYTQTMYGELMQAVADGLESSKPNDWSLSTDDLRFHYAMGIAYGLNDSSTSDYNDE
jgi:CRISPR-associated protein Cas8b/Csh1 subtype I-B